jgi:hypothetical protein
MQQGSKIRKNGDLRGLPNVRVIESSGKMLGVMTLANALRLAFKEGLDLVEVAPTASPPVCKILDFDTCVAARHRVSPCGRFSIDGGLLGLVTFEEGADRGQLGWETPASVHAVDLVIDGDSGWWSAPEARTMRAREVRDLAHELASAMRLRIELLLLGRSEIIRPPDQRA